MGRQGCRRNVGGFVVGPFSIRSHQENPYLRRLHEQAVPVTFIADLTHAFFSIY